MTHKMGCVSAIGVSSDTYCASFIFRRKKTKRRQKKKKKPRRMRVSPDKPVSTSEAFRVLEQGKVVGHTKHRSVGSNVKHLRSKDVVALFQAMEMVTSQ